MAIAPDGTVVPCQSWLTEGAGLGNILKDPFKKIWAHHIAKKLRRMTDKEGYFFEFIPGWFNESPIESYSFRWLASGATSANCGEPSDGYYVWSGSHGCGGYTVMNVRYGKGVVKPCVILDEDKIPKTNHDDVIMPSYMFR